MLGFGPPTNPQARRDWWRRQIQRQSQSRLSVADFCHQLGVSTGTFYAWKQRLRQAPAGPAARAAPTAPASERAPAPTFVPVAVRDAISATQIDIELGNQCVVRITGTIHPRLLRTAIRAAARFGNGQGGNP